MVSKLCKVFTKVYRIMQKLEDFGFGSLEELWDCIGLYAYWLRERAPRFDMGLMGLYGVETGLVVTGV